MSGGRTRRGAEATQPRHARRAGGAVAAVLLLAAAATAGAAPAPLPTPRGLVSDFAGVVDRATAARLTALLTELRERTGAEIAVVTVDSTAPDDAFDYAMRLAEAWKPGARGKDNGVVFLTAVRDRALYILTGYGVEGALPDGLVGEIRDQAILPRFRTGDYAGGILAGTERLAATIAREYGVELGGVPTVRTVRRRQPTGTVSGLPLLLLLLLFFVVLPSLANLGPRGRRRRGPWIAGPMWGTGFGGGGFGGHGGGFGGFGGGGFGGGGAGGRW